VVGREASSELKNAWTYTSNPHCFHGVTFYFLKISSVVLDFSDFFFLGGGVLSCVTLFEFLILCWQRNFLIVNNGNFDPLKSPN